MQTDSKKQMILILSGFSIMVLLLIIIFIFFSLKGIRQASADLVNTRKELVLFQAKTSGIADLKENYQKIEPDLEKIENSFINPEAPINLIEFWEQTALKFQIYINITPVSSSDSGKKDKKDAWDYMTFRLGLTGSFIDLLKFLKRIEAGPYLIEIKDLSIQEMADSNFESVKAILTLKVFTAPE